MSIRPEEISAVLRQQIAQYDGQMAMDEVGVVLRVGDGIAAVYGLKDAMVGELLEFPGGLRGMVLNLEEETLGCVLFGSEVGVKEGDTVRRTGAIARVPVGEALICRVVNAL